MPDLACAAAHNWQQENYHHSAKCYTGCINSYFVNIGPRTAVSVMPQRVRLPVPCAVCPCTVLWLQSQPSICQRPVYYSRYHESYLIVKFFTLAYSCFRNFVLALSFFYWFVLLMNSSSTTGIVPQSWKHGDVVPIPKGRDTPDPSNWPITTLPAITKISQRLVHGQLSSYFNDSCLFSRGQYGYRKKQFDRKNAYRGDGPGLPCFGSRPNIDPRAIRPLEML